MVEPPKKNFYPQKKFPHLLGMALLMLMLGCASSNLDDRPAWAQGSELPPGHPLARNYPSSRYITQVIHSTGSTFQAASDAAKEKARTTFARMILSKVTSIYQQRTQNISNQYRESLEKNIDSYIQISSKDILISGLKEILAWGDGYEGDKRYYFACYALDKVRAGNTLGGMTLEKYRDLEEINRRLTSAPGQLEKERLALEFLKASLEFDALYYQAQFFEKKIPQVTNAKALKQDCLSIVSQAIESRMISSTPKDLEEALKFAEDSLQYQTSSVVQGKIMEIKRRLPCTECNFQKFCIQCRGTKGGLITCPRCQGNLEVNITCSRCKGDGKDICSGCNGAGRVSTPCANCQSRGRITCVTCGGQGYLEGKCRACQGQGALMCRTCRGQGKMTLNQKIRQICASCRGRRYLLCSTCQGQGFLWAVKNGRRYKRSCPSHCNNGYARQRVTCRTCGGRKMFMGTLCRTCRGQGYEILNQVPCPTCRGQGGFYKGVSRVVICSACQGRRYFVCSKCQGRKVLRVRCDNWAPSKITGLFPGGFSSQQKFCDGMKTTLCPQCGGRTKIQVNCNTCQGSGRIGVCSQCQGTGQVRVSCPRCPQDHKGKVWKNCEHCKGTGLCPTCGGRGHRM